MSSSHVHVNRPRVASRGILPDELLLHISHYVIWNEDAATHGTLQVVSKRMYQLVTPDIYRHIYLTGKGLSKLSRLFSHLPLDQFSILMTTPPFPCTEIGNHDTSEGRFTTPNPDLPLILRIRQNLSYIQRLTVDMDGLTRYRDEYNDILAYARLLENWGEQRLLPNVTGVCYELSPQHNPSEKILEILMNFCQPSNLCMKWNEFDQSDPYSVMDYFRGIEYADITPILTVALIVSQPKVVNYHRIDVNFLTSLEIAYPALEKVRISLGKVTPCITLCRYYDMINYRHRGRCERIYEEGAQHDLLSKMTNQYGSAEVVSDFSIVGGLTEDSMDADDVRAFKKEYERQLKAEGNSGKVSRQNLKKAKNVKWYIGKQADQQPVCEACGDVDPEWVVRKPSELDWVRRPFEASPIGLEKYLRPGGCADREAG
ncbi:uncharacterized protein L199_000979 [Kwoniella botswanensis]|uniref:uncharacterized protein n=1 Tax=Kwoniella botswanensis TaxID=1268659 RepID=UPI00315CB807